MQDNQREMDYETIDRNEAAPSQTRDIFGNNIMLCNEECMLGPQYYVFIPTFLCLTALLIILFINVREILSTVWQIIVILSIVVLDLSYLLVGFSNPGIVVPQLHQQLLRNRPIDRRYCELCGFIRPIGSRHCSDCNCCIQGHDHHCPWIGKCVGQKNKGRFFFFIGIMFGTLILFFVAVISAGANKA